MRQLHNELAVETVHRLAQFLPVRDKLVAVYGRVASDDAALHQHRYVRRDDGADPALGKFAFPVDPCLGKRTVFVVESTGNARAEDAVFDLEILERQRRENYILAADRRGRRGDVLADVFGHAATGSRRLWR